MKRPEPICPRQTAKRKRRAHPWRQHQPGWLASDRGHRALPDKCMRVLPR